MLPLLERVVGHLERVQRIAEKQVVDREVALDHDRFEAFVIELFDRSAADDPATAARLESRWCWKPSYLRAFVEELHWGLLDGVAARWSTEERFELIEAALSKASWIDDDASIERLAPSRTRLLAPLLEATRQNIGYSEQEWRDGAPWNIAARYCEHLSLTDDPGHGVTVAPAGTLLIRLRGVDRLRWLLAIETSLATSDRDSWCVDLGSVHHLAVRKSWVLEADPVGPPISDSTFGRWTELGAVEHWEDDQYAVEGYTVTGIGQEIFGELARNDATSFRILARALLEDGRERVLAPETSGAPSPDRATAATLRHARMVAHEVRNALLPVQHALKKIWTSPTMATAELSEPRRRVDEGLARLHAFVDDSLRLTPLVTEEATSFSVMEAIDEARRQCVPGPEGGIQIETIPASANPRCRGHRGRLVLAILNLLRNAVQIGGRGVRIKISVDARELRRVTLRIRDDGPGIPDGQHATLFTNGVSHRDGGSGHGLSFVRLVVETEMGGQARLVSLPGEAGACFELELPTEEEIQ